MSGQSHDKKYIASLDIGTTSLRCFIYDINVHIVGKASAKVCFIFHKYNLDFRLVLFNISISKTNAHFFLYSKILFFFWNFSQIELLYPQPGYVEINPGDLWQSIVATIQNAISDAKLNSNDITCLGISTQRSTFVTWDRVTGETFHNFITWKDLRADSMVRKWNDSVTLKVYKLEN